jgi:hypothetical protein
MAWNISGAGPGARGPARGRGAGRAAGAVTLLKTGL